MKKHFVSNNQNIPSNEASNEYHRLRMREAELEKELHSIQSEIDSLVSQYPSLLAEGRIKIIG